MIAAEDVESFVSEAEKKGMYVVNEDSCDALVLEFDEILAKTDKLSAVEDDVSEPYKSKYEARTLLDGVVNKLEATRTIAAVEGNKARMSEMDWRVARARVRLGVISWECEEPHNAQTDLDLAMEFYVPAFVKAVAEVAGEEDTDETEASKKKLKEVLDRLVPPPLTPTPILKKHKVDAMKCLNMLGILWAGRGQVDKSFLYLLSAKRLYDLDMGPLSHADADSGAELESVYTHNLFYLAQAYGQIGETIKSSEFCYETLQRQLVSPGGLSSPRTALDWAKNCASISDFYKSLGHTKRCALALASAEAVLRDLVVPAVAASASALASAAAAASAAVAEDDGGLQRGLSEVQADVNVRWADLELLVLKRAFERESQRLLALETGSSKELDGEGEGEGEVEGDDDLGAAAVASAKALARAAKVEAEAGAGASEQQPSSVFSFGQDTVEFFTSLPVTSVAFIRSGEVTNFERARAVFLRGAARIEAAKKHYQLDGFVTDHVDLLQNHSRLYHYLALFEPDLKRKLAMEGRRVDMLQPLLGQLNKAAYEALHKQLSYELGEAYTAQLEIKMTLVREGQQQQQQLDERRMKKSDMSKCNSYAMGALAMFTNYLSFFAPSSDINARGGSKPFASMALPELLSLDFTAPDESLVTQEELRHFFNAHFSCCRLLSKMLSPPEAAPQQRAQSLVASLRRYDWLRKTAPTLCEKKGVTVDSVFLNEFEICEEMCNLLPAKIDRVFYQGESACL